MYYPDVPALEPEELELLCHEYVEHNATLDPHLADQPEAHYLHGSHQDL